MMKDSSKNKGAKINRVVEINPELRELAAREGMKGLAANLKLYGVTRDE